MKTREERLKEVFNYLRRFEGIYYIKDFADAIGVQRPGLSAAMNGNQSYLTDSLFRKIHNKYHDKISLKYLLTGEGSLLVRREDEPTQLSSTPASLEAGVEHLLNLAGQIIKENETLRRELQERIQELNAAIKEVKKLIPKKYDEANKKVIVVAED